LETLLLVYEIEKDKIQGNPKRPAAGTIIESHIDKGLGPVATCIVQTGTLNTGDTVKIGDILSKVRSLRDWHGKEIKQAPPSTPAQIIGLKAVAQMGDILSEISDKKEIRQLQKLTEKNKYNVLRAAEPVKRAEKKEEEGETVKVKVSIILKADVLGSIEAIREALEKVQTKNVKVEIIKQGLGHITESEVEEAASLGAWLIGFHNAVEPAAEVLAANKGLEIHVFDIIYELIDFVREKVKELTKAEMVIKYLGKARVIKIFRTEKKAQIVGLRILDGKITAGVKANLVRAEKVAGEGKVVRIQCAKENVNEVVTDQECGMLIEGMNEIKDGDTLEFYQEEEKR
jgi:translation initiation factor IF-2